MIQTAITALDQSDLAAGIEASRYTYPLLNAAHIVGLATLFGSILALQLRLLGVLGAFPIQPLANILPRVAAGGLVLAIMTGGLLFTVEPFDYATNTAFLAKLTIVALGIVHALYVHATPEWKALARSGSETVSARLRISALFSIVLWTFAIIVGRFIAF